MRTAAATTENDMAVAYARYFDIVSDGLKRLEASASHELTKKGGRVFICSASESQTPYFLAMPEDYYPWPAPAGESVIASEYIDAGSTLHEMLTELPDLLALSAVCTAGKVHKFRGGAREGAGRNPVPVALKKMPISIKLPKWLLDWLDQQGDSRAVLIEDALRSVHKLAPPTCRNE